MPQRTNQQNRSLHKLCQQVADTMVEYGLDLNVVADVPATRETVKALFREMGRKMYGKESTADLTTVEIQQVFEVFAKAIGQHTGEPVTWPSYLDMIQSE